MYRVTESESLFNNVQCNPYIICKLNDINLAFFHYASLYKPYPKYTIRKLATKHPWLSAYLLGPGTVTHTHTSRFYLYYINLKDMCVWHRSSILGFVRGYCSKECIRLSLFNMCPCKKQEKQCTPFAKIYVFNYKLWLSVEDQHSSRLFLRVR